VAEGALVLGLVGAVVVVPAALAWLGRRARRRCIGGSVLAPFEEIWDPVAHRTHIEVQVQAEQRAPAPAPGDPSSRGTPATQAKDPLPAVSATPHR
jgi:hypothetical protein